MSYDARETSFRDGAPAFLYRFTHGNDAWYHTNAAVAISHGGNDYEPVAGIAHGEIRLGEDGKLEPIDVEVPRDHPVAALFQVLPPATSVHLALFAVHLEEDEALLVFAGRVSPPNWGPGSKAVFRCRPFSDLMERALLPFRFTRQCNHRVYSAHGGLVLEYTGAASAATLTIESEALRTHLDDVQDLSLDLSAAAYDTLAELAAYLDGLADYSAHVYGDEDDTPSRYLFCDAGTDIASAFSIQLTHFASGLPRIGCKVNPEPYRTTFTVAAIDGSRITSQAGQLAAVDDCVLGWVETVQGYPVMVTAHDGDSVTLIWAPQGVSVGQELTFQRGCKRDGETCETVFGNTANRFAPGEEIPVDRDPHVAGIA